VAKPAVCAEFCSNKGKVAAAKKRLPPPARLRADADVYSLLADTGRLSILLALAGGELCVCDLSQVLGAGLSAVSHQLRLLRAAGLVSYRNEGKLVFYRYTGGSVVHRALRGLGALG